jgi:hypothetical protein
MTDKSSTSTDVLDATQKLGEQWVSAVKQGQSVALDVACIHRSGEIVCHRICPTTSCGSIARRAGDPAYSFTSPPNCLRLRRIALWR